MTPDDEQLAGFSNVQQAADELLEPLVRLSERRQNNIFGSVHLAVIEELEKNERGQYNGKATVRLLTTPGMRTKCLLPVPSGQAFWFGGYPPAGTLCQIAWLPLGVAVVTSIYPFNFRLLVGQQRVLDLEPGEILIQACSGVTKEEQVRTSRGLFDRHGRVHLEAREGQARLVLGDPGLPNGLTDLDGLDDDTGETTLLRIQVGNALINITQGENISIHTADSRVMLKNGLVEVIGEHVSISSPDVQIVDDSGKRLATEEFVTQVYNGHYHPPGTFVNSGGNVVGYSGSPVPQGGPAQLTTKVRVE